MALDVDEAAIKLNRAAKHYNELEKFVDANRPFRVVVETNVKTKSRLLYITQEDALVKEASVIASDSIQNIRASLDYAYWEIVSPFAASTRDKRAVQFPFSETKDRLDEAIKNRLAHRVSDKFYKYISDLAPHGGSDGNFVLYSIHEMAASDRHRKLVPATKSVDTTATKIRELIPDFPAIFGAAELEFGGHEGTFRWTVTDAYLKKCDVGQIKPPTTSIFQKTLDFDVDISFAMGPYGIPVPLFQLLGDMIYMAQDIINDMREKVGS
ncbi:MAG: hypothetical protein KAG97_07060 [Victivallales bacterium]|jgi:hypothetical protein|nr:hypothetical protein [Victivallales bacterium]